MEGNGKLGKEQTVESKLVVGITSDKKLMINTPLSALEAIKICTQVIEVLSNQVKVEAMSEGKVVKAGNILEHLKNRAYRNR